LGSIDDFNVKTFIFGVNHLKIERQLPGFELFIKNRHIILLLGRHGEFLQLKDTPPGAGCYPGKR
jgi:hypothetical protein